MCVCVCCSRCLKSIRYAAAALPFIHCTALLGPTRHHVTPCPRGAPPSACARRALVCDSHRAVLDDVAQLLAALVEASHFRAVLEPVRYHLMAPGAQARLTASSAVPVHATPAARHRPRLVHCGAIHTRRPLDTRVRVRVVVLFSARLPSHTVKPCRHPDFVTSRAQAAAPPPARWAALRRRVTAPRPAARCRQLPSSPSATPLTLQWPLVRTEPPVVAACLATACSGACLATDSSGACLATDSSGACLATACSGA